MVRSDVEMWCGPVRAGNPICRRADGTGAAAAEPRRTVRGVAAVGRIAPTLDAVAGTLPDWRAVHDDLARRDPASLSAAELDRLGESLFWLDRPEDSIAVLGSAFTAHVADDDHVGAAMAAWQLFYDHALVGELALANGWLERARRHAGNADRSEAAGFLAVAEADHAAAAGDIGEAVVHAERAVEFGRATGDADLMAMALQVKARVLVARGQVDEGIAALDEAMVSVVNGELAPLFTGWVYCNALSVCRDLADLGRAVQWCDAATRWCESLRDGQLYPGICRLHVVELECLRGSWATATAQAQRACGELTSHDPRYAGEAHYLLGELHRLTGDLDLAEEEYVRAHELGRPPQPGLGRVRMAQGRVDAALAGLRLAAAAPPASPLRRVELLVALAEAHLATDDVDDAAAIAAECASVAASVGSEYLAAVALTTEAAVHLVRRDAADACRSAGEAVVCFRALDLPYEEARARAVHGEAARLIGDADTARLELAVALDTFRRLGAEPDARRVEALIDAAPLSPLSPRETEVLRLVAKGGTNSEVAADLFVSRHTVARHLSNIYTKLGVGSRSAATAYAYEHSLI